MILFVFYMNIKNKTMTKNNKYQELNNRITQLPETYYSNIVDLFIQHECKINLHKNGQTPGISIILNHLSDKTIENIEKYITFIEKTEKENKTIIQARENVNRQFKTEENIFTSAEDMTKHSFLTSNINQTNNAFNNTFNNSFSHTNHILDMNTNAHASVSYLRNRIKNLKINLFHGNHKLFRHSSTCFWCTNPIIDVSNTVCIPINIQIEKEFNPITSMLEESYNIDGYGAFCRPECAVGYLSNENIDSTLKYERYTLLNQLYLKPDEKHVTGIKGAVSPHYVLDKFLGTLSSQEYLYMTSGVNEYKLLNKPFTHILPELHEFITITR